MTDVHDYLENQIRDIETDVRRAARKADALYKAINPVSDFGQNLRLEVFSVHQALENALDQVNRARERIRADRKARPKPGRGQELD